LKALLFARFENWPNVHAVTVVVVFPPMCANAQVVEPSPMIVRIDADELVPVFRVQSPLT
jgi:hypothetical protein